MIMPGSLLDPPSSRGHQQQQQQLRQSHQHHSRVSPTRTHSVVYNRTNSRDRNSEAASEASSEGGSSSKKVSFNQAVRVKKYSSPSAGLGGPQSQSPDSRLWFRVFQSNGGNSLLPADITTTASASNSPSLDSSSGGTGSPVASSELPGKEVRPLSTIIEANQEKSLVAPLTPPPAMSKVPRSDSRTRAENIHSYSYKGQDYAYAQATGRRSRNSSPQAVMPRHSSPAPKSVISGYGGGSRHPAGNYSHGGGGGGAGFPSEPEVDYVDPFGKEPKKDKKSLVNGVKVMFGMSSKKEKPAIEEVTTKINSPYSQFQPRPRSVSPVKMMMSELGSSSPTAAAAGNYHPHRGQTDVKKVPSNNGGSVIGAGGKELTIRNHRDLELDDDDDASVKITPVEIWDSGQMLVANTNNREQSCTNIPGEGKLMTSAEERTQVWRHKTRRKYYEDVKKDKNRDSKQGAELEAPSAPSRTRKAAVAGQGGKAKAIGYTDAKTDDDKLIISATELDKMFLEKPKAQRHAIEHQKEVQKHLSGTGYGDCELQSHHQQTQQQQQQQQLTASDEFFPYLDSYLPHMEDKSTQCCIPKARKSKRFEISQDFRVIKSNQADGSVSTFSDVPLMAEAKPPVGSRSPTRHYNSEAMGRSGNQDVIYSQIDKSRKNNSGVSRTVTVTREVDYSPNYEPPQDYIMEANPTKTLRTERFESRSPSPLMRRKESPSPMLMRRRQSPSPVSRPSRETTRTYGFNMDTHLQPNLRTTVRSPYPRKSNLEPPEEWYTVPSSHLSEEHSRARAAQRATRETIEETMSISNASSDEMVHTQSRPEPDERSAMKSVIREIDTNKREISYENPVGRRGSSVPGPYDGAGVSSGAGIWFKSLDDDYRRGMAQSEVSIPGVGLTESPLPPTYSTMSRVDKRPPRGPPSEYVHRLDYERASPVSHAYTLDRRYLEERKRNKASSLKQGPVAGRREMMDQDNSYLATASERYGPSTGSMKRFNSTRDMTSNGLEETRRGGLAQAYKARQKRASSLNRSIENQSRGGGGYDSGSQYRLAQEREPVVLYIPAVSHHNKKADEDDRMSGINLARSQSILSSSAAKKPPKYGGKKSKEDSSGGGGKMSQANKNYVTSHPRGVVEDEGDEIVQLRDENDSSRNRRLAKKDLKRSASIPKDTKFPWLQKFGIRVKAREP